jgi:hypothetical protein
MEVTKTYYEENGDPLTQMQNDPDLKMGDIVELGTNNQAGRKILQITGYSYDDITPEEWSVGGRRRQGTNKRRKRRRTIRKRK